MHARIEAAARRAGRDAHSVRLLAVSKQQPVEAIEAAAEAGQAEFGENYVQEGVAKIAALRGRPLTWHFIGQLQGNKTREVAEHFQWVHTVDRERIATRLDAQRPHFAGPLEVLLQVRLGDEPAKGGVDPGRSAAAGGRREPVAAPAAAGAHVHPAARHGRGRTARAVSPPA